MKKMLMGLSLMAFAALGVNAADKIGDTAPPLMGMEVMKGHDIAAACACCDSGKVCTDTAKKVSTARKTDSDVSIMFTPGKVYVVEFWATWCPPCIMSIPHLSKLQKEYGNKVEVIGISVDRDNPRTQMTGRETVKKFLDDPKKPKLEYTVLHDTNGNAGNAYSTPFKQRGIPHAFIIDKEGKVAWVGHPMKIDDELKKVVGN